MFHYKVVELIFYARLCRINTDSLFAGHLCGQTIVSGQRFAGAGSLWRPV